MVDEPGETRVFEQAMSFITTSFEKHAVGKTRETGWSHYDLYPSFGLWDYQVESNKQEPGFILLKQVDKKGFGLYTQRWLPDGPSLRGFHAKVTTAPLYVPGRRYGLVRYDKATGRVSRDSLLADGKGRLVIEMGADGEAGIFTLKDVPEWVALDHQMESGGRYLHTDQENRLSIRLFNRGGEHIGSAKIRVVISTKDTSVRWKDSVVTMTVPAGERVVKLPSFVFTTYKAPPPHGEPADIRFHLSIQRSSGVYKDELTVPVFFTAPYFDTVQIDDGRLVRDSAWGQGNGNGVADAGERILLYQGVHRLRLYTEDPWVLPMEERLADEVIPARWPDGYTLSSVLQISPGCPDGHVIELLGCYETKTFNPIERKLVWGRVKLTVRNTVH
jgi:hypothetical protein